MNEQQDTRRFEVGDWVHRSGDWMQEPLRNIRRISALDRARYDWWCFSVEGDGGRHPTYHCRTGMHRHATPEEIEAREIREGDWIVYHHPSANAAFTVFPADLHNVEAAARERARGDGLREGDWRHVTPEEYRAANAVPSEEEEADDALLDSRDELIPPTDEEVRLAERIEELEQVLRLTRLDLRESHSNAHLLCCARDEAQARCLHLESARDEACAARDAALAEPELPPIVYHRLRPDVFGRIVVTGDARGPDDSGRVWCATERRTNDGGYACSLYPSLLTPVEPPRPEVQLSPVPVAPVPSRRKLRWRDAIVPLTFAVAVPALYGFWMLHVVGVL